MLEPTRIDQPASPAVSSPPSAPQGASAPRGGSVTALRPVLHVIALPAGHRAHRDCVCRPVTGLVDVSGTEIMVHRVDGAAPIDQVLDELLEVGRG